MSVMNELNTSPRSCCNCVLSDPGGWLLSARRLLLSATASVMRLPWSARLAIAHGFSEVTKHPSIFGESILSAKAEKVCKATQINSISEDGCDSTTTKANAKTQTSQTANCKRQNTIHQVQLGRRLLQDDVTALPSLDTLIKVVWIWTIGFFFALSALMSDDRSQCAS